MGLLCFAGMCEWVGKAGRTLICPVQDASWWPRAAGSLEVVW